MTPEDRNKRDLPEIVADILIEQQATRATLDRHERLLELQYEQQQLMYEQMQRQNEQQQRFNEQQQQFNGQFQQQLDQLIHASTA